MILFASERDENSAGIQTMCERPYLSIKAVAGEILGSIDGLKVVDIGAGTGRVTRELASLGARVFGVEPNASRVELAEAEGGGARYVVAPAEATGLESGEFDVSLFSFSLHHVADMEVAVREACRLTRFNGRVVVIEPEAPDPTYPAMHFIDDESAAYAQAQAALGNAAMSGIIEHVRTVRFASKYRVETPADMLNDLVSVDGDRQLSDADRPAFEAAFSAALKRDQAGGYMPHWSRADLFLRK